MKVPERFLNKMVAIQLARPVYMHEYAAHVRLEQDGDELLMLKPIMAPTMPMEEAMAMRAAGQPVPLAPRQVDLLQAVVVVDINDDCVVVELMIPNADGTQVRLVHKVIPNSLLMSVDRMVVFEETAPQVTQYQETAPSPEAKRVTLK